MKIAIGFLLASGSKSWPQVVGRMIGRISMVQG